MEKHICNPKETYIFNHKTYQCGCGRYFTREEADKQQSKWIKYQKDLLAHG